jgi:hypothetical protein
VGNTWEVYVFTGYVESPNGLKATYDQVYGGEDEHEAMVAFSDAKARGARMVKIEWRG